MNGNGPNDFEAAAPGAYAASSTNDAAASSNASAYSNPSAYSSTTASTPGADPGAYPPPPYGYPPVPPPPPPGAPNPGLAALLGFIPGVGAMYNGQFAKGLAHIVIFAILVSLADHVNGIFGLLVTGWVFYMIFDAYQTARARREGLVPPDPFGLNTIGERFGLSNGPNWGDFVARPAAGTSATGAAGNSNPYAGPAADPVTGAPYSTGAYGTAAPLDPAAATPYPGTSPQDVASAYRDTYTYPGTPYPGTAPYAGSAAYAAGTVPPPPYASPYATAYGPAVPFSPVAPVAPVSGGFGLPTGAIWLIGFGVLALIGSLAHSFYWSGHILGTFGLLLLGTILLINRTLAARQMYPAGTAAYRWNLLHQNRASFLLLSVGILQGLNGLHVAYWHYTWPYLLIAVGLYQVLDRALYNRMLSETPMQPLDPYAPAQTAGAPGTEPKSSTTPSDEEVR